jgi:hypothetical protein
MLVMQNLKPLTKLLNTHNFIGIPGFFGANKGAYILKRWIDGMDFVIKHNDPTFSDLIQPLLQDKSFEEFGVLTREMIVPFYHTGDEFHNFFSYTEPLSKYVKPNTFVVTLYNSQFPESFKNMTREELLSKNWLISRMFKKAL